MHSYYKNKYKFSDQDFKNAKIFSDNVITLPLYPLLNDDQINYITNKLLEIWLEYKH